VVGDPRALITKAKGNAVADANALRAFIGDQWLPLATLGLLAVGAFVLQTIDASAAANVGTYISALTSAIALLWLVAGFRLQSEELRLQRSELKLQRLAAEQQAEELSNSAKLGSLAQIKSLLDDAERAIKGSPVGVADATQIYSAFMGGMTHWKPIFESKNPSAVMDEFQNWMPLEALARNYVRYVSSALQIYLKFHYPKQEIDYSLDAENFVYIHQSWAYNAPFLSHHIGPAALLAQHLIMMKPGLERVQLAWMVASAKSLGKNLFKDQVLEELRDKVLKHSGSLPAICTPWPK
jgi:hypothetical protein